MLKSGEAPSVEKMRTGASMSSGSKISDLGARIRCPSFGWKTAGHLQGASERASEGGMHGQAERISSLFLSG